MILRNKKGNSFCDFAMISVTGKTTNPRSRSLNASKDGRHSIARSKSRQEYEEYQG